ncbi:MAG: nuclear transport factor 2 family protein [Pseudomonadota bacterium]
MFDEKLTAIANALVEHCRNGTEAEGLATIYAEDCVSVEAAKMEEGGMGPVFEGRDAIKAKHEWWDANTEVHEFTVDGPFMHGHDRFGVIFSIDVTMKDSGQRMPMKELGIYTVQDGKIVREEFYFSA